MLLPLRWLSAVSTRLRTFLLQGNSVLNISSFSSGYKT